MKRIGITTYRNTNRVRRIWAEITHNPRVSLRELGTITGMPVTTVAYSIRKLTEAGYIEHDKALARSFSGHHSTVQDTLMLCSVCHKDLDNGEHWRCVRCSCTGCGETPRSKKDRQLCAWCFDDLEQRGERRCRVCNVIKPLDVFSTRKGVPYLYCRDCVSAKNAAEYQRVQEHRKAYNRAYYQENKERIQVHRAHYRHENWEKELAAQRRRRARRHEAARATNARYMRSYRLRPGVKERERTLKRNARVRKKLKILEEIQGKR